MHTVFNLFWSEFSCHFEGLDLGLHFYWMLIVSIHYTCTSQFSHSPVDRDWGCLLLFALRTYRMYNLRVSLIQCLPAALLEACLRSCNYGYRCAGFIELRSSCGNVSPDNSVLPVLCLVCLLGLWLYKISFFWSHCQKYKCLKTLELSEIF